MKMLCERVDANDTEILVEETKSGDKKLYITGPFLLFGKQNRNGRVYSESVMDSAVKLYQKEYIDTNRALGELNHPQSLQVDPERACIKIESLVKDKDYYHGKAKVLSTPMGKILEALLNDGVKVGVSSRGMGSTTRRGIITEVGNDFRMTTAADVVMDPSAHDAFVESIMEQKEYMLVNGVLVEQELYELEVLKKLKSAAEFQNAVLNKFSGFVNTLTAK